MFNALFRKSKKSDFFKIDNHYINRSQIRNVKVQPMMWLADGHNDLFKIEIKYPYVIGFFLYISLFISRKPHLYWFIIIYSIYLIDSTVLSVYIKHIHFDKVEKIMKFIDDHIQGELFCLLLLLLSFSF